MRIRSITPIVLVFVQILCGAPESLSAAKSNDPIEAILKEKLEKRTFTLRLQPNHSGVLYVDIDTNSYVCRIETGSLFPLPTFMR